MQTWLAAVLLTGLGLILAVLACALCVFTWCCGPQRQQRTQLVHNRKSMLLPDILRECPSLQTSSRSSFRPTPWLSSPHLQTIWIKHDATAPEVSYEQQLFDTEDGGLGRLDWADTASYADGRQFQSDPSSAPRPLVLVAAGITGDFNSRYVRHMVGAALAQGWRCCIVNFRGLAKVPLRTQRCNSPGFTGDIRQALQFAKERHPSSPLLMGGFSMGANAIAKYLAEEGNESQVIAAFGLGNLFDMNVADQHMRSTWMNRKVYCPHITACLKRAITHHMSCPIVAATADIEGIKNATTVREFDRAFARRMLGFTSTDDLYRSQSCAPHLRSMVTPMLCLNAIDDPCFPYHSLPFEEVELAANLVLACTPGGGHIGHFEGWRPRCWWTKPFVEFLAAALRNAEDGSIGTGLPPQVQDMSFKVDSGLPLDTAFTNGAVDMSHKGSVV